MQFYCQHKSVFPLFIICFLAKFENGNNVIVFLKKILYKYRYKEFPNKLIRIKI